MGNLGIGHDFGISKASIAWRWYAICDSFYKVFSLNSYIVNVHDTQIDYSLPFAS